MIINADDFGLDAAVNAAVVESFERGLCASTTIMPNMPGFDPACGLAIQHGFAARVGVHFVLTDGRPLTDGLKRCPRFCGQDGRFVLTKRPHTWRLSPGEREALRAELRAQARKCRQHGVQVAHADSHEHIHEEWGIASVVIRVCTEEGIPHLRLARNCGRRRSVGERVYRCLLNSRLRRAGLARTSYFGSVEDCIHLLARGGPASGPIDAEAMVHPGYDSAGVLIDRLSLKPLEPYVGSLMQVCHMGDSRGTGSGLPPGPCHG